MEGFGHPPNSHGGDFQQLGKRPIIMPTVEQMNRQYEHQHQMAYQQRFGASSSTRFREVGGELPLPSTIQNLDPALREKAIMVGKLVSRAASRVRRPGGQRPIGAFGEHFCQCGKDYMNICGLNNHWKLSHKMPGKPPQLYVPASVQSKFLQGLELTAFDLHSVQMQVSHQTLELMALPSRNDEPAPWAPDNGMYGNPGWADGNLAAPRPPFPPEMPGYMMRGPLPHGMPMTMGPGMHDPRERMMPMGMPPFGGEPIEPMGFAAPMRHAQPAFNYEDEYFEWSENAKEFQSCVEAWLGEAGTEACSKPEGDPGFDPENRIKDDLGFGLSRIIVEEEIWSTTAIAVLENDRLLQFMGDDRSHWAKLFYQTRNRQISATQAIGLFLITLRPKLSSKFYFELGVAMTGLIACLACNNEKKPPIDHPVQATKLMERFATDFYPQFLLHQGIVKKASALQLLGLAPTGHQRLYSTLRLLSSFLEMIGATNASVTWHVPAPTDNK